MSRPLHQDITYVQGNRLARSLPYPALSRLCSQSLSRLLCRDWVFFLPSPVHTSCGSKARVHGCNTLILKHNVFPFGHLSIRSPTSLRSVCLNIGAQHPSSLRLKCTPKINLNHTANCCRTSDDYEHLVLKSTCHCTQDDPCHDCDTRNTSVRHHPLYLSFP